MVYLPGPERRLEKSGIGFDLSYYADDIVLMTDNSRDMLKLFTICGQESDELGLEFSAEESEIMVFKFTRDNPLCIQRFQSPRVEQYKYLGVWLHEVTQYQQEHEKYVTTEANANSSVMKRRASMEF